MVVLPHLVGRGGRSTISICRRLLVFSLTWICLPMGIWSARPSFRYPSKIKLRAGVLHAPPMAIVEEMQSGELIYEGFQIDLLKRLKIFAAEDGVDLQWELSPSPTQYDEAFNFLANDCNTTDNPNLLEDCEKYDIIIGDYYSNSERFMRADLSPSWMKSAMATIKYTEKSDDEPDYTTLTQAEEAGATVCVPGGTFLSGVVRAKFPRNNYLECDLYSSASNDNNNTTCIDLLKNGDCILYADDELVLNYEASRDKALEATGESFNAQYFVWPMKENLHRPVSKLIKNWIYKAVENATVEELFYNYFDDALCPIGTAGERCELPCHPDHGISDADGTCKCKSTKFEGDDCSIVRPEELNLIPVGLRNVCYGMAACNFILVAACGVWVVKNRNRSQVKIAQPTFLLMILIGCVISTSAIFALAQQDEGDGPVKACAAIPWLYSIGFCLTFGAMFARIKRIYQVIRSAVEMKRVTISTKETLLTVAIVLGIDVFMLSIWTILDPLEWQRKITSTDLFGEPLESEGYCASSNWKVFAFLIAFFHFVLMTVACYMCYKARKIPERISNGKYVGIAMFSQIQIFVLAIPVLIMLGSDNPEASFFVRSAAIWINDLVVVSLIMGNLMYKVYQNDMERDSSEAGEGALRRGSSHMMIKKDIQSYARAMRGVKRKLSRRMAWRDYNNKNNSDATTGTATTGGTANTTTTTTTTASAATTTIPTSTVGGQPKRDSNLRVSFAPEAPPVVAAKPHFLETLMMEDEEEPMNFNGRSEQNPPANVSNLRSMFEKQIQRNNNTEVPPMFTYKNLPSSRNLPTSNSPTSCNNGCPSKQNNHG